jgi:ribosome-associated toxin RatA of RatAB toxin-antitoxin module
MYPCKTRFDATLKVGITGLPPPLHSMEEEYTSRVSAKHSRTRDSSGKESLLWTVDAASIQSKYLEHLKSHWILKPIAPSYNWTTPSSVNPKEASKVWTDVDFTIEMSMSDPILTVLLDQILKDVATRQVLAFEKRCFDIPFVSSGPNQDM